MASWLKQVPYIEGVPSSTPIPSLFTSCPPLSPPELAEEQQVAALNFIVIKGDPFLSLVNNTSMAQLWSTY